MWLIVCVVWQLKPLCCSPSWCWNALVCRYIKQTASHPQTVKILFWVQTTYNMCPPNLSYSGAVHTRYESKVRKRTVCSRGLDAPTIYFQSYRRVHGSVTKWILSGHAESTKSCNSLTLSSCSLSLSACLLPSLSLSLSDTHTQSHTSRRNQNT